MQFLQDPKEISLDSLDNERRKANRHFRKRKRNILKLKLINLKLTVRLKMSETYIRASVTLRRVTNLELI